MIQFFPSTKIQNKAAWYLVSQVEGAGECEGLHEAEVLDAALGVDVALDNHALQEAGDLPRRVAPVLALQHLRQLEAVDVERVELGLEDVHALQLRHRVRLEVEQHLGRGSAEVAAWGVRGWEGGVSTEESG